MPQSYICLMGNGTGLGLFQPKNIFHCWVTLKFCIKWRNVDSRHAGYSEGPARSGVPFDEVNLLWMVVLR
ncbi:hypothetical protein L6452_36041 [Arctium lappa]|uniref:Uncharacterized protein n=1 Tax=Arctium lappa TaxID=4217 RepID=A0ACB8Y7D6_ARCLA|nr:hypothetical protein L6452_36041 [Arctium lappa]